jgi:uncharacterized membrane protein YhaH (DUF805 family)
MKTDIMWLFFSATGRMSRKPYILAGFGLVFISLGSRFLDGYFIAQDGITSAATSFDSLYFGPVYLVTSLFVLPVGIFLAIKRAHDRNRSGWFVLLMFLPLISLWPVVEFLFLPGTQGFNQFGQDPLPPT